MWGRVVCLGSGCIETDGLGLRSLSDLSCYNSERSPTSSWGGALLSSRFLRVQMDLAVCSHFQHSAELKSTKTVQLDQVQYKLPSPFFIFFSTGSITLLLLLNRTNVRATVTTTWPFIDMEKQGRSVSPNGNYQGDVSGSTAAADVFVQTRWKSRLENVKSATETLLFRVAWIV